jgi:PhnB protein
VLIRGFFDLSSIVLTAGWDVIRGVGRGLGVTLGVGVGVAASGTSLQEMNAKVGAPIEHPRKCHVMSRITLPVRLGNNRTEQNKQLNIMNKAQDTRTIEPYLFFNGSCEEAIEFYRKALGAEVEMMMRFNESPEPQPPGMVAPGFENKIMHASFRIGQARVLASDGCSAEKPSFQGFSLSLSVPDEKEADRVFGALADGGQVKMPLTKTFWSPRFGMVEDRFGIGWMINVAPSQQK